MNGFPYMLSNEAQTKRLGVVVLQVDETIEDDLRRLLPADVARLHVTRIPSGAELTPETIAQMDGDLAHSAALLPDSDFDAIAYACTSGTTLIGAERVADRIREARRTSHVTDPLSAARAAFSHLGIRTVAIVSPYIESVAQPIRAAFAAAGLDVPVAVSFGEKVEARVARIDPRSIREAALHAAERSGAECLFLSCTNLRTLGVIDELEAKTGRPVLSSNLVLAWHMARLAGIATAPDAPGRLFAR